jgi:hypothetical protein
VTRVAKDVSAAEAENDRVFDTARRTSWRPPSARSRSRSLLPPHPTRSPSTACFKNPSISWMFMDVARGCGCGWEGVVKGQGPIVEALDPRTLQPLLHHHHRVITPHPTPPPPPTRTPVVRSHLEVEEATKSAVLEAQVRSMARTRQVANRSPMCSRQGRAQCRPHPHPSCSPSRCPLSSTKWRPCSLSCPVWSKHLWRSRFGTRKGWPATPRLTRP